MTDFSKLLNAVIGGDFTLEQLAELQSVLTEKQEVKEKKKNKYTGNILLSKRRI